MVQSHPHLRTVANQDGAAILNTQLGSITTLNETGAFVWQGLARGDSAQSIIANLSRETDVCYEAVERDVLGFIDTLRTQDLLPL